MDLQSPGTIFFNEMNKIINLVNDDMEGFRLVKFSPAKPLNIFIELRDNLNYQQINFGKKFFHLPPDTIDSSLFNDILAMPIQKNFAFKQEFNNVYVIYLLI